MERAIENLEREFQRVVGELEFHAHRLEQDWGSDFKGANNPIKLFKRVKALERQLPEIQQMYKANVKAKQEAISCLPQMLTNMQTLTNLKEAIGYSAEDLGEEDTSQGIEADCNAAEELITAWKAEISAGRMEQPDVSEVSSEDVGLTGESDAADVLTESSATNVVAPTQQQKITGARKMQAWEVVDEAEFQNLPSSIRGRCKIREVNKVYFLIREHFLPFLENNIKAATLQATGKKSKRLKKASPLTIPMLSNLGGKVRTKLFVL